LLTSAALIIITQIVLEAHRRIHVKKKKLKTHKIHTQTHRMN